MAENNIKYKFKIDSIGVTDTQDLIGVVCEIRYYFVGILNGVEKERYYIQKINYSNLSLDTFKDTLDISREELLEWLEQSIEPENLAFMKQAMHEQFYPQIRYLQPGAFKENSGS